MKCKSISFNPLPESINALPLSWDQVQMFYHLPKTSFFLTVFAATSPKLTWSLAHSQHFKSSVE